MMRSPICDMLGIQYPVFQGGMAWIADGKLAAAVSNAGGLGIISAMNADADYVREQIRLAKSLTDKPFGVNIMLMSPFAAACAQVCAEEKPAVVTTGAGSAGAYIPMWKEAGIKVIPVIASVSMAKQTERACRRRYRRRQRYCRCAHARCCRCADGYTLPRGKGMRRTPELQGHGPQS